LFVLVLFMNRHPSTPTLFPYTTLFRSSHDLLQQPGLQRLHQQQRLVLTEQHQQHSAISRILLLNPAFSADKQQRLRLLNGAAPRSEEHTSELQSRENLVCRLLLEKKNK